MAGQSLAEQGFTREIVPPYYSVKEAVLPFNKFPGVDPILGPEMKSTGEVMGTGATFASAFAKAQLAAGGAPPVSGTALIISAIPIFIRIFQEIQIYGYVFDYYSIIWKLGFAVLVSANIFYQLKN